MLCIENVFAKVKGQAITDSRLFVCRRHQRVAVCVFRTQFLTKAKYNEKGGEDE